jgi:hypothetical protein
MATRKKKRRKKSSKKRSKKRAKRSTKKRAKRCGKRPLSLLVKNYNKLGRIIRSRGGKV